jgi:DNA-directed RNA polymerase subunit K/omega
MDDFDDDLDPDIAPPEEEDDQDITTFEDVFEADAPPPETNPTADDNLDDSDEEDGLDDLNLSGTNITKIVDDVPITYICGDARILNPLMTRFEYAKIRSVRAVQIEKGDQIFVQCDSSDPSIIAEAEIQAGLCPLAVRRLVRPATSTSGPEYEFWPVRDLIWGMSQQTK